MKLATFLAGFMVATCSLHARADVSFSKDIAPILTKRCSGCHGERTNLGGYRSHTFNALLKPGTSGKPVVVAGKPDASNLLKLMVATNPDTRMPKGDQPLPKEQIALVRQWIEEGAKFDGGDPAGLLKNLLGPRKHPDAPAVYRAAVPAMSVAFMPSGKQLAVGGYNEVLIWDIGAGKLAKRIGGLPQRVQSIRLSPDGKWMAVGGGTPGEYGDLTLLEVADPSRRKVLDTFGDIVIGVCFSADGEKLVAGGADMSVRCYSTASAKRLWINKVHADFVTSVGISHDGRFVASSSKDMTVKVYSAATGELFTTYSGHNRQIGKYKGSAPVYSVVFSPDSPEAYSAGGGKWVQIWEPLKARMETGDAGDMEERFAKQGHAKYLEHHMEKDVFALEIRGGLLFAASGDGIVRSYDLGSHKEIATYKGLTDWVFGLSIDREAGQVAAGSYSGDVRIWDVKTGQLKSSFVASPTQKPRVSTR